MDELEKLRETIALSRTAEVLGLVWEAVYSRRHFDPLVKEIYKQEYEKLK